MMSIALKLCAARDDCGNAVYLVEHLSRNALAPADDRAATVRLMFGPDHEKLTQVGAWFFGIDSGRRYTLDS